MWSGRDRRDHRDHREMAEVRLRTMPLARAKQMLTAIGPCEARKPFLSAKHHPRHLPVVPVVSVAPAQAQVMRSGFAPFRPLARAFPCAAKMAAFPVSGGVP